MLEFFSESDIYIYIYSDKLANENEKKGEEVLVPPPLLQRRRGTYLAGMILRIELRKISFSSV